MEFYLLYALLVITVITRHVTIVDSCSCRAPNPYNEICQSQVAVNATVVSTSFPKGVPDSRNEVYTVRYQLDIHSVLNSPGGVDTVPDAVTSYLPTHLCGLYLAEGTTYILAGHLTDDRENPGEKVIWMMLCSLNMDVSRRVGRYQPDEIVEWLDCSNPPLYITPPAIEVVPLKRDQKENDQHDNGEIDALIELGLAEKRREMVDGLESFLSAFTGISKERLGRHLRWINGTVKMNSAMRNDA